MKQSRAMKDVDKEDLEHLIELVAVSRILAMRRLKPLAASIRTRRSEEAVTLCYERRLVESMRNVVIDLGLVEAGNTLDEALEALLFRYQGDIEEVVTTTVIDTWKELQGADERKRKRDT